MTRDFVIRGGTIVDGSGAPGWVADVKVSDDRITAIGTGLSGRHSVDATGLIVAPGFIDLHSHADFTLLRAPAAINLLSQGVTTVVGGNCGLSPFPLSASASQLGGTGPFELRADSAWSDLRGYSAALESAQPGVNVALQVGHGRIRAEVMGARDGAPNDTELSKMRAHVQRAAEQGAFGLTTGLIYPPALFASPPEVEALAAEAASHGLLYQTHLRNESGGLLDALAEALHVAEVTGVRLQISHLKSMGPANAGLAQRALARIDDARIRGIDIMCDVYPYTASSTSLLSRLPAWALEGGSAGVGLRLSDGKTRTAIQYDLQRLFDQDIDPAGIVISEVGDGPFASYTGLSVAQIARHRRTDSATVITDILVSHGDAVIVNHAMDESDVQAILQHPTSIVASDGWSFAEASVGKPHPRSFGTFPRVLGRYVRSGLMTLPEAVRRMSGAPADRVGLVDRGRIREGYFADITVFDPDQVNDQSTYESPRRLATGINLVLVNGRIAYRREMGVQRRAGRVLSKM